MRVRFLTYAEHVQRVKEEKARLECEKFVKEMRDSKEWTRAFYQQISDFMRTRK